MTLRAGALHSGRIDTAARWNRAFWIFLLLHVCVWTIIPLLAYPNVPMDVAETVSWGHEWQMGYFNHPPLSAWIEEPARVISGQQATWAIYLAAQLVTAVAYFAVWRLARRLLDPPAAFLAALLLETTFLYNLTSLEFNNNTCVLAFFALSSWFLYEALTRGQWKWWLLLGISLGLGMLSKYIMVLQIVTMVLLAVLDRDCRAWLKRPQPYIAAAVALLVFLPNLLWQIQSHFPAFHFAHSRSGNALGLVGHIYNPPLFIAGQALCLLPIVLSLIPWIGIPTRRRPLTDARERWTARFLVCLVLGPSLLFFLFSAFTGLELRREWGVPFWTLAPLLILFFFRPQSEPAARRRVFWIAALFIALNVGYGIGVAWLPPRLEGLNDVKGAYFQYPGRLLAENVDAIWSKRFPNTPLPIVGGERWLSDNVAFYSPSRPSVLIGESPKLGFAEIDEVTCPWTSVAQLRARGGVLVWDARREGEEVPQALLSRIPNARRVATLEFHWLVPRPVQTVKVGVAIVDPEK